MSNNHNDWRVYVYLTGGSAMTLSAGLSEAEAWDLCETASKMLADHATGIVSGTIGGNRGSVRLSAVEAVSIKDFRAVGR